MGETPDSFLFIPVNDSKVEFFPTKKYARICVRERQLTLLLMLPRREGKKMVECNYPWWLAYYYYYYIIIIFYSILLLFSALQVYQNLTLYIRCSF